MKTQMEAKIPHPAAVNRGGLRLVGILLILNAFYRPWLIRPRHAFNIYAEGFLNITPTALPNEPAAFIF